MQWSKNSVIVVICLPTKLFFFKHPMRKRSDIAKPDGLIHNYDDNFKTQQRLYVHIPLHCTSTDVILY